MKVDIKDEHLTETVMMLCVAAVLITLIVTVYLYVAKVAPHGEIFDTNKMEQLREGHHEAAPPVIVLPQQPAHAQQEVWHG
jgi:hypothetical protein